MDYKKFVLSYYKNAIQGVHIQRICGSEDAKKPHSHSYFQMYYVIRGRLVHTTEYGTAQLRSGDAFLIPPGKVHYIGALENAELYTFSFMPDIFGEIGETNRFAVNFLRAASWDFDPCTRAAADAAQSRLALELLDKIYEEFCAERVGFGEVIRAYALALIMIFARNLADRIPGASAEDEIAERIRHCAEYIDSNYSDQIDLGEMAKACAMSKSVFCKAFLSRTGVSFHKYLNQRRVHAALRYMEKGYKITGIYGLCGYNDFSTFYRNFKKITGRSPKQYFKENG